MRKRKVIQMKKTIVSAMIIAIIVVAVAAVAFAATERQTPAQILAGLTGKSVEEVTAARTAGTAYGAQAATAGQLEAYQAARLEQFKLQLDEAVAQGQLTQDVADARYAAMAERLENCDGTGSGLGRGYGARSGNGLRDGSGCMGGFGAGLGTCGGRGAGRGFGGLSGN
jgi:hypothetical protein